MAQAILGITETRATEAGVSSPSYEAYQILHLGFTVAPIVAGLGVWFKPKIFAYVVSAWLLLIIVNLLLVPGYFDVALRDFGLALGALALGRLSQEFST